MFALVITGTGLLVTVTVTAMLPVPPTLVADTVTEDIPVAVGVPEIRPVAVLTLNPAGKPVAL